MNFGFVIDNRTCIGCHACSVACKQENEVPLGVHRTWVKVVDRGLFPNTSRHFQVTRCNHCANPPCVRICPVTAMYKRADGIVDFDPDACIGCKACLQACPYDAIHIDPNSGTAAKCHYCAHKVESGLEPACVAVCPEHSIISGDLDDPNSEISRLLNEHPVSVRRPEQGTAPKLFYIDGDSVTLTPGAAASGSLAWSDGGAPRVPVAAGHQGLGTSYGPLFVGGPRVAEHMVQTTYTVGHKVPWHWPVPAYLVTKAIAAGIPIALLLTRILGGTSINAPVSAPASTAFEIHYASPDPIVFAAMVLALVFTGVTTVLLVLDLERPERFLRILTHPQWGSWLTRGAFILLGYTLALTLYCVAAVAAPGLESPMLVLCAVLGIAAASYTGFLFAQAEGRDFWQSPLAPVHLVLQAIMAGAGLISLMFATHNLRPFDSVIGNGDLEVTSADATLVGISLSIFALALVADAMAVLFELLTPHASHTAARAAADIWSGRFARRIRFGTLAAGRLVPALLTVWAIGALAWDATPIPSLADRVLAVTSVGAAVALALIGLYLYEHAFVVAPQEIPNS